MADVASRAGVSVMTVSRVLNGFPGVADPTRRRVEKAIAALGYQANTAARVLAGGRSRTIGVVAVESQHFGPAHVLFGIEAAAHAAGHLLTFVTLDSTGDGMGATLDRLRASHAEGVIVVAPVRGVLDALTRVHDGLPLVVVGGDTTLHAPTVAIDQRAGARRATEHLLELGHRSVHHVRGPGNWVDAAGRVRGWSDALRAAGVPRVEPLAGDWSAAGGYGAGRRLAQDPDVTAVFAANDQTAIGVLRAMHEAGRRVPDDVSVVGFDDIPEATYTVPALTTVRQDFGEVGRCCVDLLLALADGSDPTRHAVVAAELIARESTAPPARG
jgi:DNA-binding LacI/PurR family transcriptional regulator